MERFDMHMHLNPTYPLSIPDDAPEQTLAQLGQAGISGGCIFSPCPKNKDGNFIPFEERMTALEGYTRGHADRLFPVFWVHPDEPDVEKHIEDAAARGVIAYKFICDTYYVYEEKCMRLLRKIAEMGKPVIFHSGILWDNAVCGQFNRPINWEALITVPGLRFSMGHCSWPWHDECIALYGRILNHQLVFEDQNPCEMFLDLTPGTPPIYRRDLMFKLFNIGYDVKHNVLFGSDSILPAYSPDWVTGWIRRDAGLYREMGVSEEIEQKIYRDNILRFLGLSDEKVTHVSPQQTAESTLSI